MERQLRTALALLILISAAGTAAQASPSAPPPASGATLFEDQCGSCHTRDPASGPLAPSLKGVAGRKIASLSDFSYSDALKGKGGVWTDEALDAYLTDPETFAPGTQMFAGAPDPAARRAIIDYLKTAR
jgi:cytochrome c